MFHLAVSETPLLARALSERDIEFLIARQYRDGPMAGGQLSFEALYDDPFVVAAGIHHPLARRRALRLADLTAESWTLPPPDSPPGRFTLEAFRANGLDLPHAKVVTFPYAVRISLLATGRFLTVLPKSVLRFPGKHPFIKELPAKLPIASGPIGIAVLKGRRLSPTARLFVDCAREIAMPVAKIK